MPFHSLQRKALDEMVALCSYNTSPSMIRMTLTAASRRISGEDGHNIHRSTGSLVKVSSKQISRWYKH